MHTQQQGTAAESLVLEFMREKGYTALDQNFVRRFGELDLVLLAPDNSTIVFVEVRYRSRSDHGTAVDSVDTAKCRKLGITALAWLQKHHATERPVRFDVVGVQPNGPDLSLRWVQDAFDF